MQKKRFIARDMRRALELVKEEFGEDAMIISTERTGQGVELIAGIDQLPEVEIFQEAFEISDHQQKIAHAASRFTSKNQLAQEIELANQKMLASRKAQNMTLDTISKQDDTMHANEYDQEIRRLHDEISDMRLSIERFIDFQKDSFHNEDSDQEKNHFNHTRQQMNRIGLTHECQEKLLAAIEYKNIPRNNTQSLWTHIMAELSNNISVNLSDPVAKGGQYIFLGATGVGKTTTIAKLAARYVMQHNARDVVILSTDNFRLASHDQLKSLCKILGVEIQIVPEIGALAEYLHTYSERPLILVDTPGSSPGDTLWKDYMQVLRQCRALHAISVLSANSQYPIMQSSLSRYHHSQPSYSVVTKIDECHDLGGILSALFLHDTPLVYIANGQAVPDDLLIMKATQLVSTSVDIAKQHQKLIKGHSYNDSGYKERGYMH